MKIVSLRRRTYALVELTPGLHVLKPKRSWGAPWVGAPSVLQKITEEQAAILLAELERQ